MRKIRLSVINPSSSFKSLFSHQSIESTTFTIPPSKSDPLLPLLVAALIWGVAAAAAEVDGHHQASLSINYNVGQPHKREFKANGESHLQQHQQQQQATNKQANRSIVQGNPKLDQSDGDSASQIHYSGCEEQQQQQHSRAIPSPESIQIAELLARYYRVPGGYPLQASLLPQQQQTKITTAKLGGNDEKSSKTTSHQQQDFNRPELPRPLNVTVLIISWSPPILKLQWKLNELDDSDASRLDFYHQLNSEHPLGSVDGDNKSNKTAAPAIRPLLDQYDLELSITEQPPATSGGNASKSQHDLLPIGSNDDNSPGMEEELRIRRVLLDKSLSCFQVTYNIINSRFKVTEEYPPYLRSIMLERLLPATEYSLRVAAVYLGGRYRTLSDRVQFISPTDNESRRFKENTYRPIHRYPDEKRELRIGLAQVRSEELTIVVIAVIFWIATICLFFNKWGKIRMLEPYQPAYREISPTASFVAAHHHPSVHNLPNSATGGTGSCGGGGGMGSGPLAAAAVAANLVAAAASAAATGSGGGGGPSTKQMGGTSGPETATAGTNSPVAASTGNNNNILLHAHSGAGGGAQTPSDNITAQPSLEGAGSLSGSGGGGGAEFAKAAPTSGRCSDGALASSGGGGRGTGRGLLLLGHKRFESLAGCGVGGGTGVDVASTALRRTDTELNYLFQSKALALAKATSLWSKQQQKLRQLQYRAHLPSSLQQPQQQPQQQSVSHGPSELHQLEMLRRTSQALLRQRNLSHCPPVTQAQLNAIHLAGSGGLSAGASQDQSPSLAAAVRQQQFGHDQRPSMPTTRVPSSNRKTSEGCDQRGRSTSSARTSGESGAWVQAARGHGMMIGKVSQQQQQPMVGTKSLDWNDGQEKVHHGESGQRASGQQQRQPIDGSPFKGGNGGSGGSSSNKLRRLLFITKSHQHHHIATSTSSSLHKANSASLPNNSNNPMNNKTSGTDTIASVTCSQGIKMMNSSSLDNNNSDESAGGSCSGVPVIRSGALGSASVAAGASADSGSASSSSLPARVQAFDRLTDGRSPLRPPLITMIGAQEEGSKASHRHHILIEPPSPPTKAGGCEEDLLGGEQPVVVIVEGQQQQQQQRDPGQDNEDPDETLDGTSDFRQQARGQLPSGFLEHVSHQASVATNENWRPLVVDGNKSPQDVTTARQHQQQHGLQLNAAAAAAATTTKHHQDMAATQQQTRQPEPSDKRATDMDVANRNSRLNYNSSCSGGNDDETLMMMMAREQGERKPTSSKRLTTPSMEMQPEICLEAPADDSVASRGTRRASGSSMAVPLSSGPPDSFRPAPSNEPFVKLASYQQIVQQNSNSSSGNSNNAMSPTASIRRQLGTAGSCIHGPSGSMGSGGGGVRSTSGAPWASSQLSQCSSGSTEAQYRGLRHQSFYGGPCDCVRPAQAAATAAMLQASGSEAGPGALHLCSPGCTGSSAERGEQQLAPAEWLAAGGRDELGAGYTGDSPLPQPQPYQARLSYSGSDFGEYADHGHQFHHRAATGSHMAASAYYPSAAAAATAAQLIQQAEQSLRPRMSSVFVASPYSRAHLDSFAMLRALSQKKSKSAEDVAYLSSLVLQIWVKDRNPLLQSVSQQQLSSGGGGRSGSRSGAPSQAERQASSASATGTGSAASSSQVTKRQRPKSSLTVTHI